MRKKIHSIILALVLTISFCLGIGVNVNAEGPVNQTVQGEGNHYVTGNSYPSTIEVVGYDVSAKMYYVNFKLYNGSVLASGTLKYCIQLFDDSKNVIATYGLSGDKSASITGTKSETALIQADLLLSKDLPAQYNLLITVTSIAE